MGLDSYLNATKYSSAYSFSDDKSKKLYLDVLASAGLTRDDVSCGSPSSIVSFPVAYWRKANAIHNWFVKNCANGQDDCRPVSVTRDDLENLLKSVKDAIIAYQSGDKNGAGEILKPTDGFFFGSTEIDENYLDDLNLTVTQLEKILNNPKFKDWDFEYQASW